MQKTKSSKDQKKTTSIPTDSRAMARWFSEAVRDEIAELEKKGGEQRIELHAGNLISPETSPHIIYRFVLAESTLVPEDASGTLEVDVRQFKATVVAQESNLVDVQLEAAESLGPNVSRAILRVDDLGLLRKLADALDAIAVGSETTSPLAIAIFHPISTSTSKESLPGIPALDEVMGEQREVLEQACASEVTYIWGPPGTGKTYVIARLIAALVARGERVLMTSHTHAAVDQSILETVKPGVGPLADTELERDGKIIRIGRVTNPKIPDSVRLDSVIERHATDLQLEINELQRRAAPLVKSRSVLIAQIATWQRLSELRQRLAEREERASKASSNAKLQLNLQANAIRRVKTCRDELGKAERAWLFRGARVQRARQSLASAELHYGEATAAASTAAEAAQSAAEQVESLQFEVQRQIELCGRLPALEVLTQRLAPVEAELMDIEERLSELRARLDALERQIIDEARIVAATLTKCYVGGQLDDQAFDALIVDEISMALPPLLFIAGRRAFRRIILVGDFKQLPPIVRSDSELSDVRLRQDAFHLAKIARDLEPTEHRALVRLRTQRRMLPRIADVARAISYGSKNLVDHPEVHDREPPAWLDCLPESALTFVDTADLHTWSGRQAGSLSRFNFYTAQIAVELAAMAAMRVPRPAQGSGQPIGIVTPYAAQRRLLSRLIEAVKLSDWVAVGTVHTFQGGEADLIIFDSVLDEPYWTARLCNPKQSKEVKRDLNVAVTRARSKFVFIGSSEWLNRHAKPASALGQLWHHLKDNADLVPALDLIHNGFAGRVARSPSTYRVPGDDNVPAHSILDENDFFDAFFRDLTAANESIFGLVPFFGEYRWPKVEPFIRQALERGVEVTLVTPPAAEADNKFYVESAIHSLRELGAAIVPAMGLHGKDIVIDSRIHYTGSLNWASNRGRVEIMHRTEDADYAKMVLEYLQARHIRSASGRKCPHCNEDAQVVNQSRSMAPWDKQPMKIGCSDYKSHEDRFLIDIDQRAPFSQPPVCEVDSRTKYRRVKRGRGESWVCPKHPKKCERFKVIPGDV